MSQEVFIRGLASALFGGMFAWVVFSRYDDEIESVYQESKRQRYLPYIPGALLPLYLMMLTLISIPIFGFKDTMEMMLSMSFGIFLHISIFYAVLFLLIPVLRKYISSRACAMLWIIPNYLYISQQSFMEISHPAFVLYIPKRILWAVISVWMIGFLFVLIKAILEHMAFRRHILKDASEVTNPEILSVWQDEIEQARIKKPRYKVVTSPAVSTPLSIGFFQRSITVVLPEKQYSASELALIFRHEIVHICREDSQNKFFLVFCCAMFWFNPFMWIAKRKSADDLELSCDETVLLRCNDSQRSQYADLILNTAGDERGFTTCLSATASALRYRLKNIVNPVKRSSGALVVGLSFFLLCMTIGYVALSYDELSGQQLIYQTDSGNIDPAYQISGINTKLFEHNGFVECKDEDALEDYLAGLKFSKVVGNYSMSDNEEWLLLIYRGPAGDFGLRLQDRFMTVTPFGRTDKRQELYYVRSDVDWDYISSLLYTQYIQDPTVHFPPTIEIISNASDGYYYRFHGNVESYVINGIDQEKQSWWPGENEVGIQKPENNRVRLVFSHTISKAFTVLVTDAQGNLLKTYSSDQLEDYEDQKILPLESEPARYTILASFEDDTSRIDMVFTFTVDWTDPK